MLASMAFGVAGVMIVVAITEGLRVREMGRSLTRGVTSVEISPRASAERKVQPLTIRDARLLALRCPNLANVAPYVQRPSALVSCGYRYARANLMGTSGEMFQPNGLCVAVGRIFTPAEDDAKSLVCVIGGELRQRLFESADPCGSRIQLIHGHPLLLTVVGAFEPTGSRSTDYTVYVPLATAQQRILQRGNRVDGILAYTRTLGETIPAAQAARALFANLGRGVAVTSQWERVKEETEQFDKLERIILILAGGALLVGGVGILKVMLVVVSGRRSEIGLRKAVGASWQNIMLQFSLEAVTLGVVGAMSGVAVGWLGMKLAGVIVPWKPLLPPRYIFVACGSAIVVALLSGVLPAKRAADVSPIEALRQV
jgi:putative ABC transport system permease protein